LSDTFSDVDHSPDVEGALAWQDRIDGWPQMRAYKQRSYELCGDAQPRLDVGAGTGLDARALGALATDRSVAMCRAAATRPVTACRADAHALPFRDSAFGAVRADRVLQHVADPGAALRELVRVCARGGRVIACDPDQESLVIHVPGVGPGLTEKVKRLRRDVGYRHGTLARRLPGLFARAGLDAVTVEAFPLVLTDPDDAFGLPGWPRYWSNHFSKSETTEWDEGVLRGREGGFVYALLYFVIAGTRFL
jgi:SAM-dependent methyltransferase